MSGFGTRLSHFRLSCQVASSIPGNDSLFSFAINSPTKGWKKFLKVYISYDENSKSVITGLKRVSKPGRRVYVGAGEISKLKTRLSMVVLSTSKGLMTDKNAFKNKVGGEPLLMVW